MTCTDMEPLKQKVDEALICYHVSSDVEERAQCALSAVKHCVGFIERARSSSKVAGVWEAVDTLDGILVKSLLAEDVEQLLWQKKEWVESARKGRDILVMFERLPVLSDPTRCAG